MRTVERLTKLKEWLYSELCAGRSMKTPARDMQVTGVQMREPKCYLAWNPTRSNARETEESAAISVCPGMILMPNASKAQGMEEMPNDRYDNVRRPRELSRTLAVSLLFSVYEPGVRLPGFSEGGGKDISLLREGTEQGLFTLYNWLDDCMELLLTQKTVPRTDLFVNAATIDYSLYLIEGKVADARPIYYGFINAEFGCYANESDPRDIRQILE